MPTPGEALQIQGSAKPYSRTKVQSFREKPGGENELGPGRSEASPELNRKAFLVRPFSRKPSPSGRTRSGVSLAEGVGFEPTIRFPVYTLSKRAPSATRPPLRRGRCGQYSHRPR